MTRKEKRLYKKARRELLKLFGMFLLTIGLYWMLILCLSAFHVL
jgi:hypothetical protein